VNRLETIRASLQQEGPMRTRVRDEAPAVKIVIGGNVPLDGMRAGTPPALPAPTDPDA
jgi:hypothetical protein